MKARKNLIKTAIIWSMILSVLNGCFSTGQISPDNIQTKTVTLPILTSTLSPTLTPQPSETSTSVPLLPTSIPTLQLEDARTEIYRLLSGNDACSFPCWWGFIPGKTYMLDLQNYLSKFSNLADIGQASKVNKGHAWFKLPQSNQLHLDVYLEYEGEQVLDWLQVVLVTGQKVDHPSGTSYEISWDNSVLAQVTKPYSISKVFSTYGKPTEAVIFTQRAVLLNRPHPISLVLFYPQQGFMIEYVANNRSIAKSSDVTWCPDLVIPYFWFWSPSPEITRNDVFSWISGFNLYTSINVEFKSLEVATGMTVEDIYNLYVGDENTCIKTPKEIWPMPYE